MDIKAKFDRESLLTHIGKDEDFFRELLTESLRVLPNHLDTIENAIELHDTEKLRKAAHRMKGGLSSIYAAHAAHLAHELEIAAESEDLEKSADIRDELVIVMDETIEEIRKNIT
jgi:HPt (histidine-containing phosphotransfer) domain-containing protein